MKLTFEIRCSQISDHNFPPHWSNQDEWDEAYFSISFPCYVDRSMPLTDAFREKENERVLSSQVAAARVHDIGNRFVSIARRAHRPKPHRYRHILIHFVWTFSIAYFHPYVNIDSLDFSALAAADQSDHDDDDQSSLVNRLMFLNDHQQHACARFHSIRSDHSMCSLGVDKFETCRKRERERMRTALALSYRALLSNCRRPVICYICAVVFSHFVLMRTTRTRRRSILFSLRMCLPMISRLLLKYSVDLSHAGASLPSIELGQVSARAAFDRRKTRLGYSTRIKVII